MTADELLDLHRTLVSIRSVSHAEAEIAGFVEARLHGLGAEVERVGDNVIAWAGRGPRLLMNSHLDTVPPVAGWSSDPWTPCLEDGRVFGLGANDAKASVAAMIAAFACACERGGPCETALMLVPEEETGGKGTEVAWPWLRDERGWLPQGVVVGEPTELQACVRQNGLMVLELTAKGDACHAANAGRLGAHNPIWRLAEDLLALRGADLGETTLQPTVLRGAEAANQVPGEAKAVLDLRTVPGESHQELLERLRTLVGGELRARSIRLEPYACPEDAEIVRAALRAGAPRTFASATMSDQVFFRGVPAIKCGPGVSARSHTRDEFVLESEIVEGTAFYTRLIEEFARGAA